MNAETKTETNEVDFLALLLAEPTAAQLAGYAAAHAAEKAASAAAAAARRATYCPMTDEERASFDLALYVRGLRRTRELYADKQAFIASQAK